MRMKSGFTIRPKVEWKSSYRYAMPGIHPTQADAYAGVNDSAALYNNKRSLTTKKTVGIAAVFLVYTGKRMGKNSMFKPFREIKRYRCHTKTGLYARYIFKAIRIAEILGAVKTQKIFIENTVDKIYNYYQVIIIMGWISCRRTVSC